MTVNSLLKPWLSAIALLHSMILAQAADGPAKPGFVHGEVLVTRYDAASGSDLLTGGLGAEGLSGEAPRVPAAPTAEQLRTAAIYYNYRALVDVSDGGGYGSLYGPRVGPTTADAQGRIFGTEYSAYARGEDDEHHENPC